MWLFCKAGFFSTVASHTTPGDVIVRARVRKDLDRLRALYAPDLGKTTSIPGTDYPYRAAIGRSAWGNALYLAGNDVDYPNFKNEVDRLQGRARHDLYADVWRVMHGAEEKLTRSKDPVKCECSAGHNWRARKSAVGMGCPHCGRLPRYIGR